MKLIIGSCCESRFGVGELLKWSPEEIDLIERFEDGRWVVYEKAGDSVACYRVMVLTGPENCPINELSFSTVEELNQLLGLHSMECECSECHNPEDVPNS